MVLLVYILALAGSISLSASSETKSPEVTEDPSDQHPEGSIAHPQYVGLSGAYPYNNIADHIAAIGRGLTPPPPLSSKGISVLETSPAQSFPRVASPQTKSRRKQRRQRLRTFSDLELESDQPPPIPQEPDIPPEDDVEVTSKPNPPQRDFIPNLIPKEKLPDESDTSESEEGRIFKHISVHVPPEDLDEEVSAPKVIKVAREPEKHLKVIFIKPDPDTQPLPKTEVQLPPGPLQRTLVYVLTPSGVPTPIRLVKPTTPKPIPPQVYFLRYTNPNPASPTPSSAPEVREKENARPRPEPTKPPPIKQQALPPPAKAPSTPLLPVNLIQPTVTVPLALHTPILYTFKRNYKIVNTPTNYRYHTHSHGHSPTSTLSQLANNLNNHHHHHYTPLVTSPLAYPLTSTYNPNPYRYTPQNYYRHHHHLHHSHPHQYIYSAPSPLVTFSNPYPHHYYDHGHNHNSHSHRKHSHYHPVVNTRFIYSCTLFEER